VHQGQDTQVSTGAAQGARVGASVGAALGSAAEEAAQRAAAAASVIAESYGTVRERASDAVRERAAGVDTAALVRQWGAALEGVVEDGRERVATALPVALGGRVTRRRWPWAVGAAVAGAVAGTAAALAVRRLIGEDAPGAQEPEHLRAVVDLDATAPGDLPVVPPV